jgi:hypothetical protein
MFLGWFSVPGRSEIELDDRSKVAFSGGAGSDGWVGMGNGTERILKSKSGGESGSIGNIRSKDRTMQARAEVSNAFDVISSDLSICRHDGVSGWFHG